ncbi:flagellar assembly protein T N-terminal domain-containing protein [Desulfonatronospira sp.]|uniref:flagellar assembly protein T N-terminal domain-containing protein n=1 Tax=Desulfonatronospira sp. TaxID=1962951 RepID=UPI0025C3A94C|nr:flagellar assembly protein T N-terminal domain-containing protein [Desulfonatronospira sp.]
MSYSGKPGLVLPAVIKTAAGRWSACFFLVLLFFSPFSVLADSRTVVVQGQAPIISGDTVQARDEALADARIRAVEQVAGVEIEASSVLGYELMLESSTSIRSRGFIHREKVLLEHEDEHGLYHVKLEAEVSPAEAQKRLMKLLRQDRILILLQENNLGQDETVSPLENRLVQELNSMGYKNLFSVNPQSTPAGHKDFQDIEFSSVQDLALQHMADIVILGELTSESSSRLGEDFYSAHAQGWVRAYLVSEEKVLASEHFQGIRGYGPGMEQAGRDSLNNAAHKLSRHVLEEIVPRSIRRLEVVFYGLDNFSEYKRQKRLLSLMRWVQNVKSQRFHQAKTVFEVDFSENPEILASRLDLLPGLVVESFDSRKIEVNVSGQ